MTDVMAALGALASTDCPEREEALADFYAKWAAEPLVVDKWFSIQATAQLPDTLQRVEALQSHSAFNLRNPNRVRSLIGAFCQANPAGLHGAGGAGYRFLVTNVLALNSLNPQVAARMVGPLSHWRRYEPGRRQLMREALERLLAEPDLSKDVYEIASKSLA
jgi:aminopeptidase N